MDNQTIRIFRPATINYIELWEVSIAEGGGLQTTTNIPVTVSYVELSGISDNQTITVAVSWIDSDTNSSSTPSSLVTLEITDKTPPYFVTNNFTPTINANVKKITVL